MDIAQLMRRYHLGDIPHGEEGSLQVRRSLSTEVLQLSGEDVRRERLERDELNDLFTYIGWNQWDLSALRSSEGESGLMPRQQYETLAWCEMWKRYPEYYGLITEAVGGSDGLMELGRIGRREVGTKIDALHLAAGPFQCFNGRAILQALDFEDKGAGEAAVNNIAQFMRRVSHGYLGEGVPLFASQRGYSVRVLEQDWIDRFRSDVTWFEDTEEAKGVRTLNASAETLSYMVHLDNRSGCADSGPYSLGGGRWLVVRNITLREKHLFWSTPADKLPYAVTIAMVFQEPPDGLKLLINDISTIFSEPRDYLRYLCGAAAYARDEWNTPIDKIRQLNQQDIASIAYAAGMATTTVYRQVARMSRREKIMCGAKVYITDFVAPLARAAGIWDELIAKHDLLELHPTTSEAYYALKNEGAAERVLGRLLLLGEAFAPFAD